MKHQATGAVCALLLGAPGVFAAEITGGSVTLGYSAFTSDSAVKRTDIKGQAELGFNRNWAAQLDLGSYRYGFIGETGTNVTLHGIYHLNEDTSFGLFYTRDDLVGGDGDLIGLEAGFDLNNAVAAEVYVSTGDNGGIDGTIFGFDLEYDVSDRVELNAGMDRASFDFGADLTRLSIGAEYSTGDAGSLYAEFGSLDASVLGLSGSESYVGVGFRLDFGAERGATFGNRGLLDMIPGL